MGTKRDGNEGSKHKFREIVQKDKNKYQELQGSNNELFGHPLEVVKNFGVIWKVLVQAPSHHIERGQLCGYFGSGSGRCCSLCQKYEA
jgi:hypothetical protein